MPQQSNSSASGDESSADFPTPYAQYVARATGTAREKVRGRRDNNENHVQALDGQDDRRGCSEERKPLAARSDHDEFNRDPGREEERLEREARPANNPPVIESHDGVSRRDAARAAWRA